MVGLGYLDILESVPRAAYARVAFAELALRDRAAELS
jgi:hypothetical protein